MSRIDKITKQWIRSAADERAVDAGCRFDLQAADRVRQFSAKFCRHAEGDFAGKPFELLDWEWQHVVGPLYGWKDAAGSRRFSKASIWIPKKNGKSTLAAMLILYMLLADGEAAAEIYGAARDRNQAGIVFRAVRNMVNQSPALLKYLQVIASVKRIVFEQKASFYTVLSAEARKTGHGINAHFAVIDELHCCSHELYDTLRYSGAARRQSIFFEISTAGNDKTSLGYERYLYAKGVRDGSNTDDTRLLVYIAEADGNDLWEDEKQWRKANPSLGHTISLDKFRADFKEAKNGTPSDRAAFRQLRLNLWQDAIVGYFDMQQWDACSHFVVVVDTLYDRDCYGGLDLANTLDMTCFALAFPDEDGGYTLLLWCWVPEDVNQERERTNRRTYYDWIQQGLIKKTEGDELDYAQVRRDVRAIGDRFNVKSVGYDPWNAGQIAQELQSDGFTMEKVLQSIANFNEPLVMMSRLLKTGQLRHGGNPVNRWMAGNTVVRSDGLGCVMPARKKSADKIDGIVAEAMAIGQAIGKTRRDEWYEPGMLRD